jgi:hypothetical protein
LRNTVTVSSRKAVSLEQGGSSRIGLEIFVSDPYSGPVFVDCVTLNPVRSISMTIHLTLVPLVSLVAGILILMMPKLLNYIVAIYLILVGVIGLFGGGNLRL